MIEDRMRFQDALSSSIFDPLSSIFPPLSPSRPFSLSLQFEYAIGYEHSDCPLKNAPGQEIFPDALDDGDCSQVTPCRFL